MESWNARLREALVASFDDGGLELLSADIGVDYETLEGTSRPKKAFELVDYSARSGRIVELIDMAAAQPSARGCGLAGLSGGRDRHARRVSPRGCDLWG